MKELKVRQQQAANELGFSQATISLWLSGKYPANGTSEKIARAFLTWKDRRRKSPLQHTHKARQISIRNKPKPHTKTQWTTREEEMLIQEVLEHGLGNWEEKARALRTNRTVNAIQVCALYKLSLCPLASANRFHLYRTCTHTENGLHVRGRAPQTRYKELVARTSTCTDGKNTSLQQQSDATE